MFLRCKKKAAVKGKNVKKGRSGKEPPAFNLGVSPTFVS
jgi:hypothetical protein